MRLQGPSSRGLWAAVVLVLLAVVAVVAYLYFFTSIL
jgi:hypothetical protein